jgi:hypothetical protein
MKALNLNDVTRYVNDHIVDFHKKRVDGLKTLKLKAVLKRKNPYLFRAKNILKAQDLVESILNAYLSSKEEAIFGDFLEGLAIFVCEKVHGGQKSSTEGIDLEFTKGGVRYLVSVKSGPNWANSGQIKRMKANFVQAKKILGGRRRGVRIQCVEGCCYGWVAKPNKGDYEKLCGQAFWDLISGKSRLYTDIVEPLGYKAKEKNDDFNREYAKMINTFTAQFTKDFCSGGMINWKKLVKFNSARKP